MASMRKAHPGYGGKRLNAEFYATENKMKHGKHMKSHGTMTKGSYGDIGAKRQEESVKVGGFKAGSTVKASGKL